MRTAVSVDVFRNGKSTGSIRFFSTPELAQKFAQIFRPIGETEGFLYGVTGVGMTEMDVKDSVNEDEERAFFKKLWSEPIGKQ